MHAIRDRARHVARLSEELTAADGASRAAAEEWPEDLRADGLNLVVTGWPDTLEVALERLDLRSQGIHLLNVQPGSLTPPRPEIAIVRIPYDKVSVFFTRLEEFATQTTPSGNPRHAALVANIASLRAAALREMWTDAGPFPDSEGPQWWEVWLVHTGQELRLLDQVAHRDGWSITAHAIRLEQRTITAVLASAVSLGQALSSRLPLAELRRPQLVQALPDLPPSAQQELTAELVERLNPAPSSAPYVCILDTGLFPHSLFSGSISDADTHHVITLDPIDRDGHGTKLAGLALFGSLDDVLMSTGRVNLSHRLESVKIVPARTEPPNPAETYAYITAAGTAAPEVGYPRRRRVRLFANSWPGGPSDGRPSGWSATIDALSFGATVDARPDRVELLTGPDPENGRLFVVAAGNVLDVFYPPYLDVCDTSPIEDPAQAWNALTVGACTELMEVPSNQGFAGYEPLALAGDLSPFSRTSVLFARSWPIKPDIVMEGGNVLVSPNGSWQWPDSVCLTTTSRDEPQGTPLTSINMTSAASAQAAHLAARAAAAYPDLWPEMIRGLLVHAAEWTDPMKGWIAGAGSNKTERLRRIRRYGFGAPTEERVLRSAAGDVTLLVQALITPFERSPSGARLREMHLHDLPWPKDLLLDLQDTPVTLRVTLSYFIEPNPSSRGWRGRYAYPSHGLRFDLCRPGETREQFRRRLNDAAAAEEAEQTPTGVGVPWYLGPQARNRGSLHSDMWTGTAADLADAGLVGVYPISGWWKSNNRFERMDVPLRYALLISLTTPAETVDLYTPIAAQIPIPVRLAA